MELKMFSRAGDKKSHAKQTRRAGQIPAVIYKQGLEGEKISVDAPTFGAFLRGLKPGSLPTSQVTLITEGGKKRQAIVKDIQYHPTTYRILHLDFLELGDVAITAKVPIECVGVADCVGVKQGGQLRQVIRYVRVRCLPKDLPTVFTIDVKDLGMRQSRRLKDIAMEKGVRPLDKLSEVAVVVAKR